MTMTVSRAIMALAAACMGDDRQDWSLAMQAEYEVAAAHGRALSFASGCLIAACRAMATGPHGRFVLTSYAVALGIMLPMAALQIGCAVLGLPYLYPGRHGLSGAMLVGGAHEALLHNTYLRAIPSLALIQLLTGIGHLRLAWLLVERDWAAAFRWAMLTLAATVALVVFMTVLFLDSRQALMQVGVAGIELAILMIVARRDGELRPAGIPTG